MATITLMIVITFFMHGSLIAFSARVIKAYQGVREASIATFALAFGFLVIVIVPPQNAMIGYLSNMFITCGYFLIYLAICRFTETSFHRLLVFVFFPAGILVLTLSAFLRLQWLPLIYVTLVVGFVFNMTTVLTLYRSDRSRYKLSAYLTALPLFLYGLVMMGRMVVGFIYPAEILPAPSFSGTFSVMALFVLSYLWTSGFILMASQRLQSDLNDLAMNDALTRIRNRRAMREMLDFEMRRKDKGIKHFSIILLDIDHFKRVNDTYGHDVGDLVLQWLAATLQSNLRVQDAVARWGGEEFLVLLSDTLLEEAMQIAERLRSTVASSVIEIPSGSLQIAFSGGVATSAVSRSVDQLYKIADRALYVAKRTRNRIVSQDALPAIEPT
ncbi:MAG: GGDEF domain-containing protein [Chloroflexi bacterium]|nr:GGDEF domain-containing protein [Chloroflexota bacterium]